MSKGYSSIPLEKKGKFLKNKLTCSLEIKLLKKISCCIRVSASDFKEAGIVKRDFKSGRVC